MLLIKTNKLPLSQAAIIPFNSTFYNMNALPLAKKAKLSLTISMVSVISKASASITATHNTQHTLLQLFNLSSVLVQLASHKQYLHLRNKTQRERGVCKRVRMPTNILII